MATTLKTHEFKGAGRRRLYPPSEWLDGQIWKLTPGEDFACKPVSLRSTADGAARRLGLRVKTSITEDGAVILQAHQNGASG